MLNRNEIEKLIQEIGLVNNAIDLKVQLNPNGFDLTVASISGFDSCGSLDFSNQERVIPPGKEILPRKAGAQDKFGWWNLKKGVYKVKTNEIVNLPLDLIALAFSRSSLLRMGAFTQHAVWDAGFKGRSEFVLIVDNPKGLKLKQNARIAQLVFIKINPVEKGYDGIFQHTK